MTVPTLGTIRTPPLPMILTNRTYSTIGMKIWRLSCGMGPLWLGWYYVNCSLWSL